MGKRARLKKLRKELGSSKETPSSLTVFKIDKYLTRIIFVILFFTVFSIGVILRLNNLYNVVGRSPDEGIYAAQARAIAQNGSEGSRLLVKEYKADSRLWIYPPPIRLGYLWPLAALMRISNRTDENVGAYISLFFSISSLILLVILGLEFFNKWTTLFALLFMSVSPIDLAIARRTWQDAMVGFTGLLLVYLCCKINQATNKIIWYVVFLIVGSYSILIKETSAVIYSLSMIWLLWLLFMNKNPILKGIILIGVSAIGASISVAFLAHNVGGISNIIEVLRRVKEAMPNNTYAIEYQSGPWYNLLLGFWIISPLASTLCMIGIVGTFFGKGMIGDGKKERAIFGIIFFSIAFMAIAMATPYCQNMRYVSVLYAPFYLLGGLGLWRIYLFANTAFKASARVIVNTIIITIIIVGAANDYKNFDKIFLKTGIKDASIRMLKENSRILQ